MSEATMRVKRLIRPLIPDSLMAYYRRREHSKSVRHNVDVHVSDLREARRWRRLTPESYRIVSTEPDHTPPSDAVTLGDDAPRDLLGFDEVDVAVDGLAERPRMHGMRVTEPVIEPTGIAMSPAVADALGALDGVSMADVFHRALDAGFRVGLRPTVVDHPIDPCRQPIDDDVVVVLAAVPLHDVGGGSRAAQIAFELVRRGYHVVYVYAYPSSEAVDLGLRYVHPRLEEHHLDVVDRACLGRRTERGTVIVEAPIPGFVPVLDALEGQGFTIVYDVIDDWTDTSLGGDWYDESVERSISARADAVTASAEDLVDRMQRWGSAATLVPNAVNIQIFDGRSHPRPVDLPDGPLLGYHGSLYGDWFDWDALAAVARANPDATVVVIGDHRGVEYQLPANVTFLGLKAQSDLPAYLVNLDVGLVPFSVTPVTHAVSPLKVFEYLASGVPVASTPLRPVVGLDGVFTDDDLVAAVSSARSGPRPDPSVALANHAWGSRVTEMLEAAGVAVNEVQDAGPTIQIRPTIRPPAEGRWIRA